MTVAVPRPAAGTSCLPAFRPGGRPPQTRSPRCVIGGFCGTPSATGVTGRPLPGGFRRRAGPMVVYSARLKVMVKVLDFVKSGGPNLTVDGTIFELCVVL